MLEQSTQEHSFGEFSRIELKKGARNPEDEVPPHDPLGLKEDLDFLKQELKLLKTEYDPAEWKETADKRLLDFKDRLHLLQIGTQEATMAISEFLEKNLNASFRDLYELVESVSKMYNFPAKVMAGYREALQTILAQRDSIAEVCEEYGHDPAVLYEACFGRKPLGKVEIQQGPITLHFRCFDKNDFTFLLVGSFDKSGNLLHDPRSSKHMLGLSLPTVKLKALEGGSVTAERVGSNQVSQEHGPQVKDLSVSEGIRKHEQAHCLLALLPAPSRTGEEWWRVMNAAIADGKEFSSKERLEKQKTALIHALVRLGREAVGVDDASQEEILANFLEGASKEQILRIMKSKKKNFYNYKTQKLVEQEITGFYSEIQKYVKYLRTVTYSQGDAPLALREIRNEEVDVSEQLVQRHRELVFGKEYRQDIEKWVGALGTLEAKGFSREEIFYFLISQPVSRWQRFAKDCPEKKEAELMKRMVS